MSPSTVSQALNNKGYLKRETRERVREMAARLGYFAPPGMDTADKNVAGRSIRLIVTAKQHKFPDFGPRLGILPGALAGIQEAIRPYKVNLVLAEPEEAAGAKGGWAATIVLGGISAELQGFLEEEKEPVVIVGSHVPSDRISSVEIDAVAGLRMGVRHLYELGHRKIAFLNGPAERMTSDANFTGFLRATHEHGLSPEFTASVPETLSGDMLPNARSLARELLAGAWRDVTAVIGATSAITLGLAMEAQSCGLRIPDDLSILSIGGRASELWEPRLTAVFVKWERLGSIAVDLALAARTSPQLRGTRVLVRPYLDVQGSTAGPGRRASDRGA